MDSEQLITIIQAAEQGIKRVRKPIWASRFDHVKIDIIDGRPGPWVHLFAPFNKECNGRDPVDLLWPVAFGTCAANVPEYVVYDGPLPDSAEYQAEVARYEGALA